jgi:hypothetical protein
MLPFLSQRRKSDGIAMEVRRPDNMEGKEPNQDLDGVEMAMDDLCKAHDKKDYKGMAAAFKAAFDILESQPHEEASNE